MKRCRPALEGQANSNLMDPLALHGTDPLRELASWLPSCTAHLTVLQACISRLHKSSLTELLAAQSGLPLTSLLTALMLVVHGRREGSISVQNWETRGCGC